MRYIQFRIGEKNVALEESQDCEINPTLINKISPVNNPSTKYIDGFINYKGKMIDVLDLSPLYKEEKLKKFDGLIFVTKNNKTVAIKYEGFHKYIDDVYGLEVISIDEILP